MASSSRIFASPRSAARPSEPTDCAAASTVETPSGPPPPPSALPAGDECGGTSGAHDAAFTALEATPAVAEQDGGRYSVSLGRDSSSEAGSSSGVQVRYKPQVLHKKIMSLVLTD